MLSRFSFGSVLLGLAIVAPGCGGSSGGGASASRNETLFGGALMFIRAQLHVYGSGNLTLADFNGDDLPEVLYETEHSRGEAYKDVYFGAGSASDLFAPETIVSAGRGFETADFDGDGARDILSFTLYDTAAAGLPASWDWSLLRGRGDNAFDAPVPLGFPFVIGQLLPLDSAIADLNGDAKEDLLALGEGGTISVLVNRGGGAFDFPALRPALDNAHAIAAADLNGDRRDDLIEFAANYDADGVIFRGTVAVSLSRGDGTFDSRQIALDADLDVWDGVADFNRDGKGDLLGFSSLQGLVLFLGGGDGTFGAALATAVTPAFDSGSASTIADFNDDGVPDLIYSAGSAGGRDHLPKPIYLALGRGDGTFGSTPVLIDTVVLRAAAAADLDGDGHLDLLTAIQLPSSGEFLRPHFGNGDGTFQQEALPAFPMGDSNVLIGHTPFENGAFDLDADSHPDIAAFNVPARELRVLYGRDDGTFEAEARVSVGESSPLRPVDLDADGDLDFFGIGGLGSYVVIVRNYGSRDLRSLPPIRLNHDGPFDAEPANFDGDALPDLAIRLEGGAMGVAYGLGNMNFTPLSIVGNDPFAGYRDVRDVNGDGFGDFVVYHYATNGPEAGFLVLPGGAGRKFGEPVHTPLDAVQQILGDFRPQYADLNGDGRTDVFLSLSTIEAARIIIYFAQPDATFIPAQEFFVPRLAGSQAVAIDLDADGDLDIAALLIPVASLNLQDLSYVIELHGFLNDGNGNFAPSPASSFYFASINDELSANLTDLSADGVPDAYAISPGIGLGVALGLGDGTFGRTFYFDTRTAADALTGDFDADGDTDFAAPTLEGGAIEIIENRMIDD